MDDLYDYRIEFFTTADPLPPAHTRVRITHVPTGKVVEEEGENESVNRVLTRAWDKIKAPAYLQHCDPGDECDL
jgi:hypothetical protein